MVDHGTAQTVATLGSRPDVVAQRAISGDDDRGHGSPGRSLW